MCPLFLSAKLHEISLNVFRVDWCFFVDVFYLLNCTKYH